MKKLTITIANVSGYERSITLFVYKHEVNDLINQLERDGYIVKSHTVEQVADPNYKLDQVMFDACNAAMQYLIDNRRYQAMMEANDNEDIKFVSNDEAIAQLEGFLSPEPVLSEDNVDLHLRIANGL